MRLLVVHHSSVTGARLESRERVSIANTQPWRARRAARHASTNANARRARDWVSVLPQLFTTSLLIGRASEAMRPRRHACPFPHGRHGASAALESAHFSVFVPGSCHRGPVPLRSAGLIIVCFLLILSPGFSSSPYFVHKFPQTERWALQQSRHLSPWTTRADKPTDHRYSATTSTSRHHQLPAD